MHLSHIRHAWSRKHELNRLSTRGPQLGLSPTEFILAFTYSTLHLELFFIMFDYNSKMRMFTFFS